MTRRDRRKLERLEKAERRAREILRRIGIERPNAGELAHGILIVLEEEAKQ